MDFLLSLSNAYKSIFNSNFLSISYLYPFFLIAVERLTCDPLACGSYLFPPSDFSEPFAVTLKLLKYFDIIW